MNWFCQKCSKEHNSLVCNYITIKSNGNFEIKSFCENENCSAKGKSEFYCKICLKNICRKCRNEHDKNHEIIIYEDFFKDHNIIKFKSNVKEVSNWIKLINSGYENIINDIENSIKIIKVLFEKKIEKNKNLLKLFESMIDTYDLANKINNYQVRKNILNSYSVKYIFKINEKTNCNSFKIEFKSLI